jgi:MoaA/NifB/PqqE/SkfB family radical SAM enzyme/SAM-dependent methyltransferase
MAFNPDIWSRYEYEGIPIYVRGDLPVWFVPNQAGDHLLREISRGKNPPTDQYGNYFLHRLPDPPEANFPGRSLLLENTQIRELWLHITNRCNLACSHCLFASCPQDDNELDAGTLLKRAVEAHTCGCRIFSLTGGEPLVHRGLNRIIEGLLALPDSRVVILTNGLLLEQTFSRQAWDRNRIHLQVSVDGLATRHDQIRGQGSFERLRHQLNWLRQDRVPFTVSMCVERSNLGDMSGVVDFAADCGAAGIHFMWYFIRGRGDAEHFATPDEIFEQLKLASQRAESRGIGIDNLESLRGQIFSPSGTYHDGSTSGWEALAIGPDDKLYPSAALVGIAQLATPLERGLYHAWQNSAILQNVRASSVAGSNSPLRYFLGGGDSDHSFTHCGQFIGCDPYLPLYEKSMFWLISREAQRQVDNGPPRLRLKMGDILESCGSHGGVSLVHTNCLLSLADRDSRKAVKEFYSVAATQQNDDILNPVCYDEEMIRHIPREFRFRGYGCGSPVMDANIRHGETVVDLGSGRGIECFIAARLTGRDGRVYGIDMLEDMLAIARQGGAAVSRNLGYDNLEFRKGYLENLPMQDACADLFLSNCVMNLSMHKRRAFAEIFRSLKPGGRLVMSDVVCDADPPASLKNDENLRGECIGGAMTQKDLIGILDETGFTSIRLLKRFPYRTVQGHPFYSLTFEAHKPAASDLVTVVYRGPGLALTLADGNTLHTGMAECLPRQTAESLGDQVFLLDEHGAVVNLGQQDSCACGLPPEKTSAPAAGLAPQEAKQRHASGCMVCGAPLVYQSAEKPVVCSFCNEPHHSSALCEQGHFVCDRCHAHDALQVIEHICLTTQETDMLALLEQIRRHPSIPINGPEHHGLVPGIILATFRNLGGKINEETIRTGIRRGAQMIGGSCAYVGICGAATGVGVAFGLILEANPLKPTERQLVQSAVQEAIADIARQHAARCCQRDCTLALQAAARISERLLPVTLEAKAISACQQQHKNRECQGKACPLSSLSNGGHGRGPGSDQGS